MIIAGIRPLPLQITSHSTLCLNSFTISSLWQFHEIYYAMISISAIWEKFTCIYISFYKPFTTLPSIRAYVWLCKNIQVLAVSMFNHKIEK